MIVNMLKSSNQFRQKQAIYALQHFELDFRSIDISELRTKSRQIHDVHYTRRLKEWMRRYKLQLIQSKSIYSNYSNELVQPIKRKEFLFVSKHMWLSGWKEDRMKDDFELK